MDPSRPSGIANVLTAPKSKKIEEHWARYLICQQCRKILSSKRSKVLEISKDVFIHPTCKDPFIRGAIARAQKQAAAEVPAAPPAEVEPDVG